MLSPFRPESDPFDGLALSLREAGYAAADLAGSDPKAMARALSEAAGAPRAGILVALDQAEELFTRTPAETRTAFLAFLSRLLAPGLPFVVVATLRSDHLGDMQKAEGLGAEFEDFALRPLPVERIGEITRGPARIAGLQVEDELVTRITADARTTDALPLVAYALRRLYDRFASDNRIQLVEYESLRDAAAGLTPLETIVRDTAAEVISHEKPSDDELKALREAFVPGLVRINDEGGFVRQAARWETLPEASRRLLAALAGSQARLLVIRDREGAREVEVAHEALFRVWPLLAGWLEEEKEFLIGRNRLEKALADWRALPESDRGRGLVTGILLDRARDWLAGHPARFNDEEADFIRASDAAEAERKRQAEEQRRALEQARLRQAETERDAARRLTHRTLAAAVILAVVAVVAVIAGVLAYQAERRAVAALAAGTETAEAMVVDLAREFRDREGVSASLVEDILNRALALQRRLSELGGSSPRLRSGISSALSEIAQAYLQTGASEAGGIAAARVAAEEAQSIAAALVSAEPDNAEWAGSLVRAEIALGDALLRSGDRQAASEHFRDGLAAAEKAAVLAPNDFAVERDLALSLNRVADSLVPAGETEEALALYERSRTLREALLDEVREAPGRAEDRILLLRDLAVSYVKVGDLMRRAGREGEAIGLYEKSLRLRQDLVAEAPDNTKYQRDLAVGFQRVGAVAFRLLDYEKALASFEAARDIHAALSRSDPGRSDWRFDLSVAEENVADTYLQLDRVGEARSALRSALATREELVASDPDNLDWKRALAVAAQKLGEAAYRSGDAEDAITQTRRALALGEEVASAAPDNVQSSLDVIVTLIKLAEFGDDPLARLTQALEMARRLEAAGTLPQDKDGWPAEIERRLEDARSVGAAQ